MRLLIYFVLNYFMAFQYNYGGELVQTLQKPAITAIITTVCLRIGQPKGEARKCPGTRHFLGLAGVLKYYFCFFFVFHYLFIFQIDELMEGPEIYKKPY